MKTTLILVGVLLAILLVGAGAYVYVHSGRMATPHSDSSVNPPVQYAKPEVTSTKGTTPPLPPPHTPPHKTR